jgi:spermidine/putrescine transport system permease protein
VSAPAATLPEAAIPLQPERSSSFFLMRWWRNPWRKPRLLEGLTWIYLLWSLLPVAIAILFSFNKGKSRVTWQGFSLRWYITDPNLSVLHDAELHTALIHTLVLGVATTVITIPLGVAFALGLDRWHGRLPAFWNFQMLLSFVVPELVLGVSLLFVATNLDTPFKAGTWGQILGLVTFQLSYPVIIVRARLLTIGKQYEEAAADLGASRTSAIRRVLLPLLYPAIFASTVLVFADVIDDFIIAKYLSVNSGTDTVSVLIYDTARGAPTPALNALATLLLLFSLGAVVIGFLGYRIMSRGQGESGIGSFAGQV